MMSIKISTLPLLVYKSELEQCFPLSMESPGGSTVTLTHDAMVLCIFLENHPRFQYISYTLTGF